QNTGKCDALNPRRETGEALERVDDQTRNRNDRASFNEKAMEVDKPARCGCKGCWKKSISVWSRIRFVKPERHRDRRCGRYQPEQKEGCRIEFRHFQHPAAHKRNAHESRILRMREQNDAERQSGGEDEEVDNMEPGRIPVGLRTASK